VSVDVGTGRSALDGVAILAGVAAGTLDELARRAVPLRLEAGAWLFRAGDPGERLFIVRSGRLRIVVPTEEGERVVREVGPGAALGELALLTGSDRSAAVKAVRDSELLELDAAHFEALLVRDPAFAVAVARELARLLQASGGLEQPAARPAVFSLRPLAAGAPVRELGLALAAVLRRYGSVALLEERDAGESDRAEALDRAEREHARVVLLDEAGSGPWSDFAVRQSDRRLVVATPGAHGLRLEADADLVCVGAFPAGELAAVLEAVEPRAHHLVDGAGDADGIGRIARRLVGRALGVVLSGGGARGFAHIGALEILADEGFEVDRVGGCSMGALVAAMTAAGWSAGEMRDRCHAEFVRRRPFNDYTLPRVSLIRSRKAARMLTRLFGEQRVEELPRPLYTVSSDLVSSRLVVHRRGSIVEAVGASMSIPGIAPPLLRANGLLVDGGVLNNLPVDAMAESPEGPIVAVDVIRRLDGQAADEGRSLPSIVETLARATVLGSAERAERNRALALLVIAPEVQDVALRGFGQLDRAVEAGRLAARRALDDGGAERLRAALS
jgi:NTE family protein